MSEEIIEQRPDGGNHPEKILFNNFIILKEFNNIVDVVKMEDLLEIVPKTKRGRVKWNPIFNCLKKGIQDRIIQEMNSMWEEQDMPAKLAILEKQKEKFSRLNVNEKLWRPQLADVKAQLRAHEVAILLKQKEELSARVNEAEPKVDAAKAIILKKRSCIQARQSEIQQYQKKVDDLFQNYFNEKNEKQAIKMKSKVHDSIEQLSWTEEVLEIRD